ncbi:MAG TPA: iron-containing alcohol dehydrogenase [Chthonomonadaceae bacterium]|nr:iron-containing alcohol dehydrogenase [Chthonomonadaceae bacterium]
MRFEFDTANRILFGLETWKEAPALAVEMGRRTLVVTGRTTGRVHPLCDRLAERGVESTLFSVTGEPTVDTIRQGVQAARAAGCDMVLGCGGGSALDAGKAIAALLTNGGDPLDYLEIVGQGRPLTQPSAPYIAIPTTAGTGAEVTRNAVLGVPEQQVKVSLRSLSMLPRVAIVDPTLTLGLPPEVTARTGMDALTQVIEPFVSHRANPFTDAFCREGLCRAARSLLQAYRHGDDVQAREDMALASLCGGLALANAGLGAVHGFAGPFGGMFEAPHGALCAALLPHVMAINIRALEQRQPESEALRRYAEIAQILTGDPAATAQDGAAWIKTLCAALSIPSLSAYGLTPDAFPTLTAKAARANSMQGNPLPLTESELFEILSKSGGR